MKNFSKKLSFVMATAMVVTSLYAPQNAAAAGKNAMVIKGSKTSVKTKNLFLTGQTVNLDAMVNGKLVKNKNLTWKSSDKSVVSVDKNGVIKAVKASDKPVYVSFTTKGKKKVTVKTAVTVCVRASKMMLTPSAVTVKAGEKAEVAATFELSEKVKAAKAEDTTYNVFAKSSDDSVAKVTVDGRKIVVEGVAKSATPVTITVYSTQVKSLKAAEKAKIKLTEELKVTVNGKFDAKQVKTNKIFVTGSNLPTKASAYAVKNVNGVVVNLKEDKVEVNADGTAATLEAVVAQLQEGKYTVKVAEDEAEFTAVKAVVDKIVIDPADKAVIKGMTGTDATKAYAYYKVFDNFGEDVTSEILGANIYANGAVPSKKGVVEFSQTSPYIIDNSKVSLTLVDQNTGKSANAVLTVSRESMLSESVFKGVYDKKNKKFVETIGERADLKDYVLLFTGKDQYDHEIAAKDAWKKLQVTIGGATGLKAETTMPEQLKIDGKEYITFSLGRFTQDKLNAGEATVQAFSLANGKQSTPAKINVVASQEVKTLSISNGPKTIVAGEEAELSFSAADADGKPVTDYDVLKRVQLNGGKKVGNKDGLRFVKRAGKAVLLYMPAAKEDITRSVPEFVSYVTKTNNVGNTTLTVNPARIPTKISGLKKDTVTGVTRHGIVDTDGHVLFVTASSIVVKDQYGDDMSVSDIGDKYQLRVKVDEKSGVFSTCGAIKGTNSPTTTAVTYTKAELATPKNVTLVKAVATKEAVGVKQIESGSVDVEVSLLKLKDGSTTEYVDVDGSKYEFKISAVNTADLRDVAIEEIKLRKATADGKTPASKAAVEVSGMFEGKKIALVEKHDYEIITGTDNIPEEKTLKDDSTIGKSKVSVIVLDGKGTRLDREYEYGKKARAAASAKINDGEAGKLSKGAAIGVTQVLAAIDLKDQYDTTFVPGANDVFVTFSNYDSDKVKVTMNGSKEAQIVSGLEKDDVITVKLTFAGSSFVFEKDFTIKD